MFSRKHFLPLVLVIFSTGLLAQTPADTTQTEEIILIAEALPEYPGGQLELIRFINSKLMYPKDARKKGIEGKVVISFVVERDGSVQSESMKVERSVYPSLDEEAIRVLKLMPNWKPAMQSGRTVRCKYAVPITFALQ